MKKQLKLAALAAAVLATGAANAAVSSSTGNGSFILYAYNTVTTGYYIRDLGALLNDFLPSSVPAALVGDNPLAGNKTPEAGLTQTFAPDQAFVTWLGGASNSDIRWGAFAADSLNNNLGGGVARLLVASSQAATGINPTNVAITTAGGNTQFNGIAGAGNANLTGVSLSFASGVTSPMTTFGGLGAANNNTLGGAASLYLYTRTSVSGGGPAAETEFKNSLNTATFTLNGDGSATYALAPAAAVPLPGAVWMMGAGLAAIGGMVRRRKAAAQA